MPQPKPTHQHIQSARAAALFTCEQSDSTARILNFSMIRSIFFSLWMTACQPRSEANTTSLFSPALLVHTKANWRNTTNRTLNKRDIKIINTTSVNNNNKNKNNNNGESKVIKRKQKSKCHGWVQAIGGESLGPGFRGSQ